MRVRVAVPAFAAIVSLILAGGVTAPDGAAVTTPVEVAEEAETESVAWAPPENAADGGAPAPNPPSDEWEPAAETQSVGTVDVPDVPAVPTVPEVDAAATAPAEDVQSAASPSPADEVSAAPGNPSATTAPNEDTAPIDHPEA